MKRLNLTTVLSGSKGLLTSRLGGERPSRKVKSAYDSMLSQAPTPARNQSLRASRSSEPTIREESMVKM